MNLPLYFLVLRRFWFVVVLGFVLAVAMAFATMAKVSLSQGISYRQQETWQAATRLFVTQKGFPWGRLVFPASSAAAGPGTGESASSGLQFADPGRLQGLAVLYAQLMNGDLIRRRIGSSASRGAFIGATAVTDPTTGSLLPLLDVSSRAHTPRSAARVSQAAAELFRSYIAQHQTAAGIPENQRVLLQVVSTRATLVSGRKKTLAIVAFLAVMIATVGLAFVLENLRPGKYAVEPASAKPHASPERNVA